MELSPAFFCRGRLSTHKSLRGLLHGREIAKFVCIYVVSSWRSLRWRTHVFIKQRFGSGRWLSVSLLTWKEVICINLKGFTCTRVHKRYSKSDPPEWRSSWHPRCNSPRLQDLLLWPYVWTYMKVTLFPVSASPECNLCPWSAETEPVKRNKIHVYK